MGIRVELRTEQGEVVTGLNDPTGGVFDAAGDFDALLPQGGAASSEAASTYTLLQYVDPYGDTMFNTSQMAALLNDIDVAKPRARSPLELRGLERLRAIAERCRDGVHLYVWFLGD